MRLSGIMIVAIALAACRSESPPTHSASTPSNAFEANLVWMRDANNAAFRRIAAAELVIMCCPDRPDDVPMIRGHGPEACLELSRFIDRERDQAVLSSALLDWGPSCYETIPLSSLLGTLPRARGDARTFLVLILARMDPTPEIVLHLTQQLGILEKSALLEDALASLGESDLDPVVDALRDPRVLVRRRAASVLWRVFSEGPVDLPEALVALERALHDPDPEVADRAEGALRGREKAAETSLDKYVVEASPLYGVQFLARRKAFCHSKAATEVLERQARDKHLTTAYLAKRAIALRARRCAEAASPKRQ